MMPIKLVSIACLAASLSIVHGSAMAQRKAAQPKNDEVVEIKAADPAMRAAFKKAQSTLNDFLLVTQAPGNKLQSVALRIVIHQGKKTEYLWVTPFTVRGMGFSGKVNNMPTVLTNIQMGQEVIFARKDVVDWMYVDPATKTMHGNFTTCALLQKAPASEVNEMKKRYGLDCSK